MPRRFLQRRQPGHMPTDFEETEYAYKPYGAQRLAREASVGLSAVGRGHGGFQQNFHVERHNRDEIDRIHEREKETLQILLRADAKYVPVPAAGMMGGMSMECAEGAEEVRVLACTGKDTCARARARASSSYSGGQRQRSGSRENLL